MRLKMAVFIIASVITASSLVCAETIAADAWPPAHSIAKLPPETKTISVPVDVMDGMLVHKIDPEYPKQAKKAHISGNVIIRATISRTEGNFRPLRCVQSGDATGAIA